MRSADLARLAGVTVRTLRHYHQMGVLPEPPRRSNGYRDYGVKDLIRVLRVRQLSSLGIPLDQTTSLLDGTDIEPEGAAHMLAQLDDQLAEQMERIAHQRRLIAHLRTHDAQPDLPTELVPFDSFFRASGTSGPVAQMDRDQAILLSHFADEAGRALLKQLYQEMSERPDLLTAYTELAHRFAEVDSASPQEQIAEVALGLTSIFSELLKALPPEYNEIDLGRASEFFHAYATDNYNSGQRMVLRLLAEELP